MEQNTVQFKGFIEDIETKERFEINSLQDLFNFYLKRIDKNIELYQSGQDIKNIDEVSLIVYKTICIDEESIILDKADKNDTTLYKHDSKNQNLDFYKKVILAVINNCHNPSDGKIYSFEDAFNIMILNDSCISYSGIGPHQYIKYKDGKFLLHSFKVNNFTETVEEYNFTDEDKKLPFVIYDNEQNFKTRLSFVLYVLRKKSLVD